MKELKIKIEKTLGEKISDEMVTHFLELSFEKTFDKKQFLAEALKSQNRIESF